MYYDTMYGINIKKNDSPYNRLDSYFPRRINKSVERLMNLGFPQSLCKAAFIISHFNVFRAAEYLLDNMIKFDEEHHCYYLEGRSFTIR